MKRIAPIFFLLIALAPAALVPQAAHADTVLRICTATGNCGVCDIVATAVTIGKWLITGAAGLALVVITWASISLATSAGNSDKIGEAKKQIIGSVIGVGIVFAAFYLVFWVILAFANPSQQFRYSEDPATGEKINAVGGLTGVLKGTAWWNLCNEADLRASAENETANCKYWGDGTPCKEDRKSICFAGSCVPVGSAEVQNKINALGGYALPPTASTCDYLAAVDRVFKDYSCQPNAACNPDKIESGLCSGDGTTVCCEPKNFTPRSDPANAPATIVTAPTAPGTITCNPPYSSEERAARNRIASIGGIQINNGGITNGAWCNGATYQDYRDPATCNSGCTDVGKLQTRVFSYLENIKTECGNFTISGGSELGHSVRGDHSAGLAVDIAGVSYAAFASCLNTAFFRPTQPGSFIKKICTHANYDPANSFSYNCGNTETEEHIHVSFN